MTADIIDNRWAVLDDLLGVNVVEQVSQELGRFAFYGRCSTEDNQDPETSLGWQLGNAAKFVEPLGGQITAQFFDIGRSRSVPWDRREEASRLLAEMKRPDRKWDALVVGEGTRCWFGNQFSLIAPRFAAYGVDVWVPELGGKFDPRNASHKMMMTFLGGMSESERQHVQARVRSAMDAQVLNEGRHQGGRAPYGYQVADGGPHPNPRKAAEGYRLKILVLDAPAAEVVQRIFAEYLDGSGDRAIATGLNRDGIPCPSASRPEQNRHRRGDGWQDSTVRAILTNPRYTGFAFFGRTTKHEMLIDPDDVAAGHITRFRPAPREQIVRSREQAHPEVISVDTFTDVQLLRRSKAAGGLAGSRKQERGQKATKRVYLLRGRVRCGYCERRMEGTPRQDRIYYRCAARSIVPGSPLLETHPKNVYLPERLVVEPVNGWLGHLFAPDRRERTVRDMFDVGPTGAGSNRAEHWQRIAHEADRDVHRFQEAIRAGAALDALIEPLNHAQALREQATRELQRLPATQRPVSRDDIHQILDSLGDVTGVLRRGQPTGLQKLYQALRLELTYTAESRMVQVTIRPGRDSARVRGGT